MICFSCRKYTPSLDDVGAYLVLYWIPTRVDGRSGKPVVSITNSPVAPGAYIVTLSFILLFIVHINLQVCYANYHHFHDITF